MARCEANNKNLSCVLFVMSLVLAVTSAFVVPSAPRASGGVTTMRETSRSHISVRYNNRRAASVAALKVSEEETVGEVVEEAVEEVAAVAAEQADNMNVRSFFAPNANIRLGSSRDQDGKSNVWAVEPKMRVEQGEEVEAPTESKIPVVAGIFGALVLAIVATIALLPSPDSL